MGSGKTEAEIRDWFRQKMDLDPTSPAMITRPAEISVRPVAENSIRLVDIVKADPKRVHPPTGDEDYRVTVPGLDGVTIPVTEKNLDRALLAQVLRENAEDGDHIILSVN